ncbi:MAG: lyase domain protein repeat-containing protein [Chthonomonadales bacterium]|nr:lyase domain protein repeat-containing protein [Chthonomonadales bacterium]
MIAFIVPKRQPKPQAQSAYTTRRSKPKPFWYQGALIPHDSTLLSCLLWQQIRGIRFCPDPARIVLCVSFSNRPPGSCIIEIMQPLNPDQNLFMDASLPSAEAAAHMKELEDKNWRVRFDAAMALAKLKDPWALEALYAAIQNKKSNIRYDVAWALASIGDLRAVEPLGVAYKEWWRLSERNSIAKLLFQIGGEELPYRLLSSTMLTAVQKVNSLEGLMGIVYRERVPYEKELWYLHDYGIDNVQTFCERLCRQKDTKESVKGGAKAVLAELQNRANASMLLRASTRNEPGEAAELLRGATGESTASPPEELLRPSETSSEQSSPTKPGILSRLFKRN